MIFYPFHYASSFVASCLRLGAGAPGEPVTLAAPPILYEFEGCPYCRIAREAVSEAGVTVLVRPCPKGGKRFRPMVQNFFRVEDLPAPLIRHLNGLWRRRWTVVVAAWIAALACWFGVWLLPDQYESRAQVFVQTETVLQPVLGDVVANPDYADRVEVMTIMAMPTRHKRRIGQFKTLM